MHEVRAVGFSGRVREVIGWVGVRRIVAAVLGAAVCIGALVWLLRAPPSPVESQLPFASVGATTSSSPAPTGDPPSRPSPDGPVTVHVAGAVVKPGVYTLAPGARVNDAVSAAGGALPEARLDKVNLAAQAVDGSQVYVPSAAEVAGSSVPGGASGAGTRPGAPSTGGTLASAPVDLNRAGPDELDGLPGVGPATAAAIVTYRDEHGPFASVDDLLDVPGIGPAKLAGLADQVTV